MFRYKYSYSFSLYEPGVYTFCTSDLGLSCNDFYKRRSENQKLAVFWHKKKGPAKTKFKVITAEEDFKYKEECNESSSNNSSKNEFNQIPGKKHG